MKYWKKILNIIIILLIFIVISDNCISERSSCEQREELFNKSLFCKGMSAMLLSNASKNNEILYLAIVQCIAEYEAREKCNKKSNIGIPDPAENNK